MSMISRLMALRSYRKDVTPLRLINGGEASENASPDLTMENIWARHDQMSNRGAERKGAACVLGFAEDATNTMRTLLRQVGLGPCASCMHVDQLQDIASFVEPFRYLVINIDAFEDIDAAVTALLAFRRLRADVVVILVSAAVLNDDLGDERRMICDATLRAPVSLARLHRAVPAAFENNTTMRHELEMGRLRTDFSYRTYLA